MITKISAFLLTTLVASSIYGQPPPQHGRFELLTAAELDFSGEFELNYVGHLNIFAPDLDGRWGINAGALKLNYASSDTFKRELIREEYALNNLVTKVQEGESYSAQMNRKKYVVNNASWSFYAQPLFMLSNRTQAGSALYVHAHIELVVDNWAD